VPTETFSFPLALSMANSLLFSALFQKSQGIDMLFPASPLCRLSPLRFGRVAIFSNARFLLELRLSYAEPSFLSKAPRIMAIMKACFSPFSLSNLLLSTEKAIPRLLPSVPPVLFSGDRKNSVLPPCPFSFSYSTPPLRIFKAPLVLLLKADPVSSSAVA